MTIRVWCLESFTSFILVTGLSIEEPRFNRTTVNEGFNCSYSLELTLPRIGKTHKFDGSIIHTSYSKGRIRPNSFLIEKMLERPSAAHSPKHPPTYFETICHTHLDPPLLHFLNRRHRILEVLCFL